MGDPVAGDEVDLGGLRNRFSNGICVTDIWTEAAPGSAFRTEFTSVQLGDLGLYRYHGPAVHSASRRPGQIRSNPVDNFLVLIALNLPFEVGQGGTWTAVHPGHFTLLNTRDPFEAAVDAPAGQILSELILSIPGDALRKHVPDADDRCARSIPANEGAGRIFESLARSVHGEGPALSTAQADCFSSMLTSAAGIAVLSGSEPDGPGLTRREAGHARLRLQASLFIDCCLGDPRLDATMVATHCHVSLRHLYAAFETSAESVATTIRSRRLERCRADLRDPQLRHQTVYQIAARWGFHHPEHFSQAYRACFGHPPSRDRGPCGGGTADAPGATPARRRWSQP